MLFSKNTVFLDYQLLAHTPPIFLSAVHIATAVLSLECIAVIYCLNKSGVACPTDMLKNPCR
jgi:hypothetical protein